MHFNREQINNVSKYFADMSKILFASIVIGYFLPSALGPIITLSTLVIGSVFAIGFVTISVAILK